MRIDQLLPAYHRGDAIGDEATYLRRFFLSQGYESEIYRLSSDRDLESESKDFGAFSGPSSGDITILHFALPSPLTGAFRKLRSKKVLIHHNVTSPGFFAGTSDEMVRIARLGREELRSLAGDVDVALADSAFNARELVEYGFREPQVFPLYVDFAKYRKPMNAFLHRLFRDGRTNILFVGRVAPNKRIEDLIKVAFYYKKFISPLVRLVIVGKTESLPVYYRALVRLADDFLLTPEEMVFAGHLPDEEMFALYRAADVFLSMSEHEGFCLPLVESMIFDLPVMAYDSTAVPDTLDGCGILLKEKRVDRAAELLDAVVRDRALREKIVLGQRERLERLESVGREPFLFRMIEELRGI
ncbi:MAG: glycosyltransferase family 4 protein [Candidatus Aminicenantes bacterium]|nr:glycosyltransferase family 4 protein [Candidatus Aminicenantes bacterium]